jgi:hypothetical protein
MYEVRMPRFTAEQSLVSSERRYRTAGAWSEGVFEQSVIPQLRIQCTQIKCVSDGSGGLDCECSHWKITP